MSSTLPTTRFAPTRRLQTIPQYVFWELDARKRVHRDAGRTLLDLGIGSPDQAVPEPVLHAIREATRRPELSRYPSFRGHPEFLAAVAGYLADRFGIAAEPERDLISVSGSKEALAEILLAMCEVDDVVLVPEIFYPVYARATQLAGATPVFVPFTSDGRLDVDAVDPALLARARVLIANYPCNPTTTTVELSELARLVEFARRHGLLLVSDLAYAELGFDGYRPPSALQVEGASDCTVELHSASKSFNMAGFRVGFVVGNREVINTLDCYRTNIGYGAPSLPQIAATAAFAGHREILPPIVAEYTRRRDAMVEAFRAQGWSVTPPKAAMYMWMPVPEGFDDWAWTEHCMREHGIVVTPGLAFGAAGTGNFRMSLVQPAEVLAGAVTTIASGRTA